MQVGMGTDRTGNPANKQLNKTVRRPSASTTIDLRGSNSTSEVFALEFLRTNNALPIA